MHWLLTPDSFKGCLSAEMVAQAMAAGIGRADPAAACELLPMADGGEGTLSVLHRALGGEWRSFEVNNAGGRPCRAACLFLDDGSALIEVARVIGLEAAGAAPVAARSSYGVGQLMRACLDAGAQRLMVALGGSSTNDGGAGCLAALGLRLLDADGEALSGTPDDLARLQRLETDGLDPRLAEVPLEVWSDVDNPLLGARGASRVFAPQKGARADELPALEAALQRFAAFADRAWGQAASTLPGSGAAGGLGYALKLIGGVLQSGAGAVAHHVRLADAIARADWVVTGEGRSDVQTLAGKVPSEVARQAHLAGVPVTLLSGALDEETRLAALFDGCFSVCPGPMPLSAALADAAELIANASEQLARALCAARRRPL